MNPSTTVLLAAKSLLNSPRVIAWGVFGTVFAGFCFVLSFFYVFSVNLLAAELDRHVRDLSQIAAALVDVEKHEQLVRPEQSASAAFGAALAPLVNFHRENDNIGYVYTIRETPDGRQVVVLDTMHDPRIDLLQKVYGRRTVPAKFLADYQESEESAVADRVLREGNPFVFPKPYTDQFGTFVEARSPLRDSAGRYVGYAVVDYDLERYTQRLNEVRIAGLVAVGLALVLSIVMGNIARLLRQRAVESVAAALAAGAEMREQRDLAAKANAAKSELLAIASHDLKNPLSAIAGMSGLLLQRKRTQADQAAVRDDVDTLETIHASARHMSEIVRGILVTEGIEHGGLPFNPVPVDLLALCGEVVRFNAPAAVKKQVTLRMEVAEGLALTGDPKLLREAIDNYVSNAIKYAPKGRSTTIVLAARALDAGIEIAVRDEGLGLTADDRAKVFGKFQKLSARPTGGETSTGLGLSIVKTIAELHQGEVGCDSEPGKGARFWLRLPAAQPPAAES